MRIKYVDSANTITRSFLYKRAPPKRELVVYPLVPSGLSLTSPEIESQ